MAKKKGPLDKFVDQFNVLRPGGPGDDILKGKKRPEPPKKRPEPPKKPASPWRK